MKAAIIGAGNVGKTIFHDLQRVRMIEEITLVGRSLDKLRAEVEDARDAAVVREEYGPRLHCGFSWFRPIIWWTIWCCVTA